MTFTQLNLSPLMEQRAKELQAAYPIVQYISGRRSLESQAHAMAINYLQDPRSYLSRNYVHAAELQSALDTQSHGNSVAAIAQIILTAMETNPALVQSPHLHGDAVDLIPLEYLDGDLTPTGQEVMGWIRDCPDTVDFRTREGKLVRWHWSVRSSAEI